MIHWHIFRVGDVLRRTNNGEGRDGEIFDYTRDVDTLPVIRARSDGREFLANFNVYDWEVVERGPNW